MQDDAILNLSELMKLGTIAPALSGILDRFERLFARIDVVKTPAAEGFSDPWLTAEQARKYLGNMSKTTFDKYRYKTTPRLVGRPLDGRILYKQSDLDNFVRLYEVKSAGIA